MLRGSKLEHDVTMIAIVNVKEKAGTDIADETTEVTVVHLRWTSMRLIGGEQ